MEGKVTTLMKTLAALALLMVTAAPAATAQTADLTGKWAGTFSIITPDGTPRDQPIELTLTQKGKDLTGTAGPNAERQWPVSKGTVAGTKVAFDVTTDEGLVIKFTLTSAKDRLQGDADASSEGQTRKAKVDVTRAK